MSSKILKNLVKDKIQKLPLIHYSVEHPVLTFEKTAYAENGIVKEKYLPLVNVNDEQIPIITGSGYFKPRSEEHTSELQSRI